MQIPDLINGLFEFSGGLFILRNIVTLLKDKQVKGVSILSTFYFCSWGAYNLFFYPHLNQWLSFTGSIFITIVNLIYVSLMIYYKKKNG